eukprot:scaffold167689_cov30-Tisochrysis_lutea.AAC.3
MGCPRKSDLVIRPVAGFAPEIGPRCVCHASMCRPCRDEHKPDRSPFRFNRSSRSHSGCYPMAACSMRKTTQANVPSNTPNSSSEAACLLLLIDLSPTTSRLVMTGRW